LKSRLDNKETELVQVHARLIAANRKMAELETEIEELKTTEE